MSESVLQLLIFYGGLVIFGVAGSAYALLAYRRGRRTGTITTADFDAANARAGVTRALFLSLRPAAAQQPNPRRRISA